MRREPDAAQSLGSWRSRGLCAAARVGAPGITGVGGGWKGVGSTGGTAETAVVF